MDLRLGSEMWKGLNSLLKHRPRAGVLQHEEIRTSCNLHLCLVQLRRSLGNAQECLARAGDSIRFTNVRRTVSAGVITSRATRAGVGTCVFPRES